MVIWDKNFVVINAYSQYLQCVDLKHILKLIFHASAYKVNVKNMKVIKIKSEFF